MMGPVLILNTVSGFAWVWSPYEAEIVVYGPSFHCTAHTTNPLRVWLNALKDLIDKNPIQEILI